MRHALTRTAAFLAGLSVVAPAVIAPATAATAAAPQRVAVSFTDQQRLGATSGRVTSTVPGCRSATSVIVRAHYEFTNKTSRVVEVRGFRCADGVSGFVVRLNAQFDNAGSQGRWSIVRSYGVVAGLHGTGTLTGSPSSTGFADHFTGTVIWS